jgi:hypothetical protein
LLECLSLFTAPVVASQKTKERIKEITFGIGAILVPLAIIIGTLGIVAGIIMKLFFNK